MRQVFLECATVVKIHGINGGLIVNHMCDSYQVFSKIKKVFVGDDKKEFGIKKCSPYKSSALIILDGVSDADSAMAFRGKTLFAMRDDIQKNDGDFFIADLIGLDVIDSSSGEIYGTLKEITNCGAQDLYVIARENKPDAYIPAIKEFIKEISLEKGIFVSVIEGMIE